MELTSLPPYGEEATLIVFQSSSACSLCGRPAYPSQGSHADLAGYGRDRGPGCGARFVAITTSYRLDGTWRAALKAVRPDLPVVEYKNRYVKS